MFKKFKNKNSLISNLQGFATIWIILIAVVIIGLGAFIFLKLNLEDKNQTGFLNSLKIQNTQEQTKKDSSSVFSKIQEIQDNQTEKIDTDQDGLSDKEEKEIHKTDPNKIDTDDDGLSDWQEIVVYKTNPLKADTDNDGTNDKQEIENNSDPNGEGQKNMNGTGGSPLGNVFMKK